MTYVEKVKEKLQNSERSRERIALWEKVSAASEQGNVESVKSTLVAPIQELEKKFKATIEKLQKML